MSKFQSKLYLFSDVYDPRLEEIFGLKNMNIFELYKTQELSDKGADSLEDIVTTCYRNYKYLIVVKYKPKLLTALIMMGVNFMMFRVRNIKAQSRLEELHDLSLKVAELTDSSNDYLNKLGGVLNHSEYSLTSSAHYELYGLNSDIVDFVGHFESTIQSSIWDDLIKDFGVSN